MKIKDYLVILFFVYPLLIFSSEQNEQTVYWPSDSLVLGELKIDSKPTIVVKDLEGYSSDVYYKDLLYIEKIIFVSTEQGEAEALQDILFFEKAMNRNQPLDVLIEATHRLYEGSGPGGSGVSSRVFVKNGINGGSAAFTVQSNLILPYGRYIIKESIPYDELDGRISSHRYNYLNKRKTNKTE